MQRAGVFMSAKSFVSVSIICEATRFAIIEFKFNTKQEGAWVLGKISCLLTLTQFLENNMTINARRCLHLFRKDARG